MARDFTSAAQRLGLTDLRFHDLRHTGNTLAAATGASLADLMARMGHASVDAALRYQHGTRTQDTAIAGGRRPVGHDRPGPPGLSAGSNRPGDDGGLCCRPARRSRSRPER